MRAGPEWCLGGSGVVEGARAGARKAGWLLMVDWRWRASGARWVVRCPRALRPPPFSLGLFPRLAPPTRLRHRPTRRQAQASPPPLLPARRPPSLPAFAPAAPGSPPRPRVSHALPLHEPAAANALRRRLPAPSPAAPSPTLPRIHAPPASTDDSFPACLPSTSSRPSRECIVSWIL